jgi:predicted molibdopterin-dependent oxidoreductase YjgC
MVKVHLRLRPACCRWKLLTSAAAAAVAAAAAFAAARVCMVEVDKRLKPACCTPAYDGAVINTDTDEASTRMFLVSIVLM